MGEVIGQGIPCQFSALPRPSLVPCALRRGRVPRAPAQATYALGYNLAIEYLADVEKRLELEAFRHLDEHVLAPASRRLRAWEFLEVHAQGEAEHAAIGHAAVCGLVPAAHAGLLHDAAEDHDRDFAVFYDALAAALE